MAVGGVGAGVAGCRAAVGAGATEAVGVGGGIGLARGVRGWGGGIFLLPALMLGRWATAKEAAATTSLFVWLNSIAGLAGASLAGRIDLELGLLVPFASVVLVGGFLGSRYGSRVSSQSGIRGLLVVVLVLAAFKMVLALVG